MRAKKDINIRIGANIQATRECVGYTQEELSEVIGITPNHLSAIERGASGASLETIEKLCYTFGISADALLFGNREQDDFAREIAVQLNQLNPEYRPKVKKLLAAVLDMLPG